MMNNSKVHKEEGTLSYYIEDKNKYGSPVYIPVVDVRDGPAERALATQMISATNSSKYIRPSEYNKSKFQ